MCRESGTKLIKELIIEGKEIHKGVTIYPWSSLKKISVRTMHLIITVYSEALKGIPSRAKIMLFYK